jgi:hypothetical protein
MYTAWNTVIGPLCSIGYAVDESGKPIAIPTNLDNPDDKGSTMIVVPGFADGSLSSREIDIYNGLHNLLYPMLLALTFLNCRNTSVIEHKPDETMSRSHQKRHARPLVTFRTLEIEAVRKIFAQESGHNTGLQRALHHCRAHFKDYREHGLFGKNKGLYWWGAQIRGTSTHGVALKDYKVKAAGNGN